MSELIWAKLPNRGILRISGGDAADFLQSLVSNDVTGASREQAVYATLLTPQGKFLHDFFLLRDEDGFLLDCEADRADDLIRRLGLYRLRADVVLADESAAWSVFAILDGDIPAMAGYFYDDPRAEALGRRAILPEGAAPPGREAPFEAWDSARLALGIPDGSRDLVVERAFLLEGRMDEWNAIDFHKGCYVGQELTARTRYRGKLRKRLTPVRVTGVLPPPGTPVLAGDATVGELRSGVGDRALAMLRLDRPDAPLQAGNTGLTVAD